MYTYKGNQFIQIPYPDAGTTQESSFTINTPIAVDKIRITTAGLIGSPYYVPLLVWSDIVNNYIGTLCNRFIYEDLANNVNIFQDPVDPNNGLEFCFPNKVQLTGNYKLRFLVNDSTVPVGVNPLNNNDVYILVEYFVKDT